MRKWLIPVGIIVVLLLMAVSSYNGLVGVEADTKTAWSKVESAYQRRNDLIDNLVSTVKASADFEKSTLEAVINARAKATSISIDPTNVTPEQLAQFNQVQGGMSSALSRLLVTVEQYPSLKANENFLKLQDELASTENQILTARTRYNEAIKPYNNHVKVFPNSIFTGWFGFKEKPFFEAVVGADKAPDVEFNFDKKEAK